MHPLLTTIDLASVPGGDTVPVYQRIFRYADVSFIDVYLHMQCSTTPINADDSYNLSKTKKQKAGPFVCSLLFSSPLVLYMPKNVFSRS